MFAALLAWITTKIGKYVMGALAIFVTVGGALADVFYRGRKDGEARIVEADKQAAAKAEAQISDVKTEVSKMSDKDVDAKLREWNITK